MNVEQLLTGSGFATHYSYTEEPRQGRYGFPRNLAPAIEDYLSVRFKNGLYSHQVEAIETALAGKNVVISTGTASGKTVAFAVPVFQQLLADPKSRALFFYPTKALAGDQLASLFVMSKSLGLRDVTYKFDGDTTKDDRISALKNGRLLLCNPDILHTTMLRRSREALFQELFRNLKYVILDECHIYSGAFGSNTAFVMRRLRQICKRLGAEPRFLAASATTKDPKAHLEKLTGVEFEIVTENGSPTGGREFYMVSSGNIAEFLATLVHGQKRFIVFNHSRKTTELQYYEFKNAYPDLASKVMPYRSGYEPNDRAQIERSLRNGELCGVFSTSALELGIDIPDMEYCVLVGIPATAMSFWQRTGRVGRQLDMMGKVVICPLDNAIDDYYREYPENLFSRPLEKLVLHLDNRQLLLSHFACARAESGNFSSPDFSEQIFGKDFANISNLVQRLDITDDILIQPEPHMAFGLRGIDDPTYEITTLGGEERMGTISWSQILREAYPQAVYRHKGDAFRVEKVLTREQLIRVKKEKDFALTSPIGYMQVREKTGQGGMIYRMSSWAEKLIMWHTSLSVVTSTAGFREKIGNQWVQTRYPQPYQRRILSEGVWLWFNSSFESVDRKSLNALAHALANVYTINYPCDPHELATHVVRDGDEAKLYILDTASGGLGVSTFFFDAFTNLLGQARRLLERCDHCDPDEEYFDKGCPSCIQVPRWYEDNDQLSKKGALKLLSQVENLISSTEPRVQETEAYRDRALGVVTSLTALETEAAEVAVSEEPTHFVRMIACGSIIKLASGSLQGTVTNCFYKDGRVEYQLETPDREMRIKDLGSNLILVRGDYVGMCLTCGADGLPEDEKVCPECGTDF
jgi:DEAD/DEAH box helicase domain-containing protein